MAIDFQKIKEDVVNVGVTVGAKAKDVSGVAKLKIDIKSKENELDKLYAALGRVYFTAHQSETGLPEETLFCGIRKAEEELLSLRQELEQR